MTRFIFMVIALLFSVFSSNTIMYAISKADVIQDHDSIPQQQNPCTGVIVDKDGEPVIGAAIIVKGTDLGASSDVNGRFSIANVQPKSSLVISFVGCNPDTVVWDGAPLNITLKDSSNAGAIPEQDSIQEQTPKADAIQEQDSIQEQTPNADAIQEQTPKADAIQEQDSIPQQQNSCSGVIIDKDGEPIIGASIIVKGTDLGASSDVNGCFSIANVQPKSTLVISYVGCNPASVVWDGAPLNITLENNVKALDEVVVVGFGTQSKVNLTGAVSTIGAKEINARPINSVVDAMQGTVPGMNFSVGAGGGALNSNKRFNIRGIGTIGAGSSVSPLVLIDGIVGDLNAINPQDVESISVLKDAAAASIYGSRAAGGVILVTTKRGKEEEAQINYNNNFRFSSPLNMPKMLNSYDWALYMNDACKYEGSGVWISEAKLQQIKDAMSNPSAPTMFPNPSTGRFELWDNSDLLPVGNTDWLRKHFGNSFAQEHNLSITGGSETIKYYISANFLGQDGALQYSTDKRRRYNIIGKISAQLKPWLNLAYTNRFTRIDYKAPSFIADNTGEFYHNVCRYWPIIPVTDPNGNYTVPSFISQILNGGDYKTQSDEFIHQISFVISPISGWSLNAEFNYSSNSQFNHHDEQTVYNYDINNVPYIIANNTSSVSEYAYKSNYFNPNIYSEYSRAFGGHNLKVMAGYQSEWFRYRTINAKQNSIIAGLPTLDTSSADAKVSGGYFDWSTVGVFGRLNYDFLGRYLFEANIRYDGSSRFTKDKRWNWFPSFSCGWNIAEESFWESLKSNINLLKIRASWGKLGNQNTDNWYPFFPTIAFNPQGGNWIINGQKPNTSSEPALVSALLTWEKNRTWDIGLDWSALNNRLSGSIEYFERKTYDMVGPAPELPDILGTAVPKVNNLDMTSRGWELSISWNDHIADFSYGATFTLSDNQVTIDKYPNPSKNFDFKYYNGAKLNDIWGYTTIGIAKTNEEMQQHLSTVDQSQLGSKWAAGDIMYADINGDGKISKGQNTFDDHGDLSKIGNSTPRYNFGLNLDGAWKGFDLKVFFQGTMKRDYMPGNAVFWGATGQGKWQAMGFQQHLDYFRDDPNNPLGLNLDSYYPRNAWNGGRNTQTQTRYIQNAAYCRLKNLTLGYTIPNEITRKLFIQNFRLFVSAENLLTITKFTGLSDPELIDAGGWGFAQTYPLSKTFSCGFNVTF